MIIKKDGKRLIVHERFFYEPKSEKGIWVTYCSGCENDECKIPEKTRRTIISCTGSKHTSTSNTVNDTNITRTIICSAIYSITR
jgi:hypothetical protein